MKRFFALLTVLLVLFAQPCMADRQTLAGDDGTLFYGMLADGVPVGFIASRTASGDRMSFGVMTASGWQGSLYTVVLDENDAFVRLIISNYKDGVCDASLHCRSDGSLTLFSYDQGEITGSVIRTSDSATAYTITNGEASNPQPGSTQTLTGALAVPGVSLHVQQLENRTVYCVQAANGEPYAAVQVHGDGSVAAARYFDGEALSYNAAENTCTIGMMEDGTWASGSVVLAADGSTSRIP